MLSRAAATRSSMSASSATLRCVPFVQRLSSASSSSYQHHRQQQCVLSTLPGARTTAHPSTLLSSASSSSLSSARRWFSDDADDALAEEEPRDVMEADVVIVGAGPAGLGAAIRLKQLNPDLEVTVVEKGAEVGAHILSGNVFEPRALDELLPDWREMDGCPIETKATKDVMLLLTEDSAVSFPHPAWLGNTNAEKPNYIVSLSLVCRWLCAHAEELGVDVYPGFAAAEVLYEHNHRGERCVVGIATGDMGVDKHGKRKDTFARGMELRAKQTIFAEGCRGSLSERVMDEFELRRDCDVQTYGIGVKEVWEVPTGGNSTHTPGLVQHTVGWPSPTDTYSGTFLYHMEPNLVLCGMVTGLDYGNAYTNPYKAFQQWKHHPSVSRHLEGGTCISYGARAINEGGYQSIPHVSFRGGALVGCAAGLLNVAKIKGSHTALKSGMLAAEAVCATLASAPTVESLEAEAAAARGETGGGAQRDSLRAQTKPRYPVLGHGWGLEAAGYEAALKASWVYEELYAVRNFHPSFHKIAEWRASLSKMIPVVGPLISKLMKPLDGLWGFLAYGGLESFVLRGRGWWTFRNEHGITDAQRTRPIAECKEIEYPQPDGVLSFDILTNLQRSGTNHDDDQPSHLRIKPERAEVPVSESFQRYGAPETRFCPARVYEFVTDNDDGVTNPRLVINAQNCVHCKTCDIKTPSEYIRWTVPEGGGGPAYEVM